MQTIEPDLYCCFLDRVRRRNTVRVHTPETSMIEERFVRDDERKLLQLLLDL